MLNSIIVHKIKQYLPNASSLNISKTDQRTSLYCTTVFCAQIYRETILIQQN